MPSDIHGLGANLEQIFTEDEIVVVLPVGFG